MEQHLFSSTTPFTPPTSEDGRLSWLRLIRSRRVGPGTFNRLIRDHGSAEAALLALPEIAREAEIADYTPCPLGVAQAEMRAGQRAGLHLVLSCDAAYPSQLHDLKDPPPILWCAGNVALLSAPSVAIVGTRNASGSGLRIARDLALELAAQNFVIVSGLARGIDRAAHEGAGAAATIAVLPGGLLRIAPEEHRDLAKSIAQSGALISEHPPEMPPLARHFAIRNRLISGLSQAVVVVEAAERSGSLITARDALDQGREVMAVPGHPLEPRAAGCNRLLRDGATLVRHAADVAEALAQPGPRPTAPPQTGRKQRAAPAAPSEFTEALETRVLNLLSQTPLSQSELGQRLTLPPSDLSALLLDLELSRHIERRPGGLLARRI